MRFIDKAIEISHDRLTMVQDIQDYESRLFGHTV